MRLKLSLSRPGGVTDDILVTVDTTVTVGSIADAIRRGDPRGQGAAGGGTVTLRVDDDGRTLLASSTVADSSLRSGQRVSLVPADIADPMVEDPIATVVVVAGPDAGKQFPLRGGANQIGRERGNDVRLADPQVSKYHARVNVTEVVEVVDLGSSNGTLVGGEAVPRAILRPDDVAVLGDTELRVVHSGRSTVATGQGVDYNRSPRLDVVFEGTTFPGPDVPRRQRPGRLPLIPLLAPVVLGCVMFALTRQLITVLFVALSPFMVLGNVIEGRVVGKRELKEAIASFRQQLVELRDDMTRTSGAEAGSRRREHPATSEVAEAALRREPTLWSYRPDQRGFLQVRLGLGCLPSRSHIELPSRNEAIPELWNELTDLQCDFLEVDGVPVVGDLVESGSLGIAGPRVSALALARALVVQLVGLHSPSELVVASVASSGTSDDWEWLKWLPHAGSDFSPLQAEHLVSGPGGALRLVAELEDLVDRRRNDESENSNGGSLPAIVLLVENDAPIERSRLVELAERGRGLGVHLIWIAVTVSALPAACRTFAEVDTTVDGQISVGYVDGGTRVERVLAERLDAGAVTQLARSLSPVVDAGARIDDASDLPSSASLVSLIDADLVRSADAVVDRWRSSNSLPGGDERRRGRESHLRALIGQASGQSLVLDLRQHGPHALVGGTTGSGKSEFLQSWVMAMAVDHSPNKVTFLFVDYKGGSAFSECVNLPHSVGLVTDLSPHLVQRALTSLNAELRYREEILQRKKAKDLLEIEGDPDAPPSLVIVVDEFAALVNDVPEFVDGVVNIAQRGRSLGLHLLLATQRPAGVIKGNLRANTNLRVALRVADEDDSEDVIGTKAAASFDPGIPGRAIVKVGPGRLTPFQSGYVGGWTSDVPPPPKIVVQDLAFGSGAEWEMPEDGVAAATRVGPNDLERLVSNVRKANDVVGLPAPRRPWLDRLADVYDLARSPQSRTDHELVFGILDDPERQRQIPTSFFPDRDGNMAIYGTGGSGKSTLLRTLAVVAGLGIRGGPCHVYGLDFGARGLQMLEPLPHVGAVIQADDPERLERLLRYLRSTIDERAARYAKVNAGTITEYRQAASAPEEPRILLLVDGMAAFRSAYELGQNAKWFDLFQSIAADGRPVGVHVVLTADRSNAVPTALSSVIQRRVVLRLAGENEYMNLGVPIDIFDASTPPGRGFLDNREVQVTVLGGSPNTARQAAAIERLATEMLASSKRAPAPPVERLAERVRLVDLPTEVGGLPAVGLSDETLAPIGFVPEDILLVVGPPQSGKSSVLASMALSVRRVRPGPLVYMAAGRSPLEGMVPWDSVMVGPDLVADAAEELIHSIDEGRLPAAVVLDDISGFVSSSAEAGLLDLVKSCRSNGVFLATDSETSSLGSWALQAAVKAPRHGIALQPDQFDGDNVFKTAFPRVSRADFPPGRGFYVRAGRVGKVQFALPELDAE